MTSRRYWRPGRLVDSDGKGIGDVLYRYHPGEATGQLQSAGRPELFEILMAGKPVELHLQGGDAIRISVVDAQGEFRLASKGS